MRSGVDEHQAIEHIIGQLQTRYAAVHSDAHVAETVRSIYAGFTGQPVRDFVPLLVERQAHETLDGQAPDPDQGRG